MKDILLLSDRLAGEIGNNMGASIGKTSCCSKGDESSNLNVVLEARERAVAKVMYFAACAEQSSEHPIAKGMSKIFENRLLDCSSSITLYSVCCSCSDSYKGGGPGYWRRP